MGLTWHTECERCHRTVTLPYLMKRCPECQERIEAETMHRLADRLAGPPEPFPWPAWLALWLAVGTLAGATLIAFEVFRR